MRDSAPLPAEVAFRLGSAAIGLVGGLVLGTTLAAWRLHHGWPGTSLPNWAFGGSAFGALFGALFCTAAWNVAEGLVAFGAGAAEVDPDDEWLERRDVPWWSKAIFVAGVALSIYAAW